MSSYPVSSGYHISRVQSHFSFISSNKWLCTIKFPQIIHALFLHIQYPVATTSHEYKATFKPLFLHIQLQVAMYHLFPTSNYKKPCTFPAVTSGYHISRVQSASYPVTSVYHLIPTSKKAAFPSYPVCNQWLP